MSKRKVRLRKCRARLALLPEEERAAAAARDDSGEDPARHIILPINTEKLDFENKNGKWHTPMFTPPKSSNYLINGKGKISQFFGFFLPRNWPKFDEKKFRGKTTGSS